MKKLIPIIGILFYLTSLLASGSHRVKPPYRPSDEERADVVYFNESAQLMDIESDPEDSWGRIKLENSELNEDQKTLMKALTPVVKTFPYAVFHRGELYYKSDDNCTVVGEKLFKRDITHICRVHDYCYLGLQDYSDGLSFKEKLTTCNEVFKEDLFRVCESTKVTSICKAAAQIMKFTVEKVPLSFRVFVSGQNKQALFLTKVQKLLEENPNLYKLNKKIGFFNIEKFQNKMRSFCDQQKTFMEKYKKRKLYLSYGSWDKRVLIPDVKFPECYEENGNLFVRSPEIKTI